MTTDQHTPVDQLPYAAQLVTPLPYAESELRTTITIAVGEASTCWSNLSGAGVFDDETAAGIAGLLIREVLRLTNMGKPNLGCATTQEIADELATRVRLGFAGSPTYRSVDPH